MFIFKVLAYGLAISVISAFTLPAQTSRVKQLELNISRSLLVLPEHGADLRYHIEEAKGVTIFWIANRGGHEVHFVPTWIMADGKAHRTPEDQPIVPSPRIHISPHGRLYLIPPSGFNDLILTEIRIGPDTGPFIDQETPIGIEERGRQ
jgi:hypothetical protein